MKSSSSMRVVTPPLPANYREAKRALAAVARVDQAKNIRDKAIAMEVYAYQAKDGELAGYAVEIKMRAERRIGELMANQPERRGQHKKVSEKPFPTLEAQGVDKNLADRSRKAAAKDEAEFEAAVAKSKSMVIAAAEGNKAVITEARRERHENKKQHRAAREQELATKIVELPRRRYGVIYADPEWRFEFYSELGKTNSSADNHYTTSALDEIKRRSISDLAADDCVLFLWATVPMLPQALEVMGAWGFEYKSGACWVKNKAGTGYWFRNQHELLLVGTRGKVPAPAEGTQWPSVVEEKVGRHSAKPERFAAMIEHYFPNVPKIELNRRGPARPGWDAWGNEAEAAE